MAALEYCSLRGRKGFGGARARGRCGVEPSCFTTGSEDIRY